MDYKKLIPHAICILLLLLISIAFFPDAFQGKVISQPDAIQMKGKENEIKKFKKKREKPPCGPISFLVECPLFIQVRLTMGIF